MKTTVNAFKLFALLALLTGIFYPLLMTGIAMACFPRQSRGSIVKVDNLPVGSELIAQEFTGTGAIHSRPSDCNYETLPSGATNLGPASRQRNTAVLSRVAQWHSAYGLNTNVPPEMATASASGLDPDISVMAARIQLTRVAKVRNWDRDQVRKAVDILQKLSTRFPGGQYKEGTVNVLVLNLALQHI
ncbi:MAG: potassium-transporting ATPase subunit C [Fibrobacterota bacterium]